MTLMHIMQWQMLMSNYVFSANHKSQSCLICKSERSRNSAPGPLILFCQLKHLILKRNHYLRDRKSDTKSWDIKHFAPIRVDLFVYFPPHSAGTHLYQFRGQVPYGNMQCLLFQPSFHSGILSKLTQTHKYT